MKKWQSIKKNDPAKSDLIINEIKTELKIIKIKK